ncbi:UDP-N-acetylmuramate:L-alanyl-gamma-D-glutamyl-meso-diaminopimelate ligase [Agarivorans sp. B2Z047]|uniref:UDP-N-acetylmuramate:L-alanyl-gamma-D-glutamyl- meso-diaminopimelate ligase n=1 Tax=Agarivorans sp. B2Z047 TaxID=2652721 RepID=UPI00128E3775|nr:UDP-N-acetylmuramate:L-alanyl-gamma-D-glutamyl-meso-diaminopimelate ligase [Agarivorans sp. B2Z047]MPW31684.1 UDP-N-acetylmuramate:L-alanyl-gamma-D-glutamyl-meso-diaminopimelate ligase [Agarivorans sp. B2Z047]UQN42356.1 UDP-N-acetylmuramate:L-alanyl-gamma-D-glutamyl-meso-diaminopimelate ligase [Agarivorans sp. B2Z047]
MHIHILGICGTFMGGLAMLARESGMRVTGSDLNVYPPMSTQLESLGIELIQGYDPEQLEPAPDLVVVGNAMSRGNPCVEYVLDKGLKYCSGPEWLKQHILPEKWVLAVAGTHGKTTTASMLAWILEDNDMAPGYLIGGVPRNFSGSARLGDTPFFVVEADEYDSAFFDKRSKFVHYQPRTLVLNNLEFDHADIFDDLAAIQKQFHHLMRIVPASGRVIAPKNNVAIQQVIKQGCWSDLEQTEDGEAWQWHANKSDCSELDIVLNGQSQGILSWDLIGQHNAENALMAIAAARHVGVLPSLAIDSLQKFLPPKRRLELLAERNGIRLFDDFAHHPSAISSTLAGLRAQVGKQRIIAILEARSNTMKMGVHQERLAESLQMADVVFLYQPDQSNLYIANTAATLKQAKVASSIAEIVEQVAEMMAEGDQILVMSNGGFEGIHTKLSASIKD